MLFLIVVFIVAVAASALLNQDDRKAVMAEYCDLECKANKIWDCSICC